MHALSISVNAFKFCSCFDTINLIPNITYWWTNILSLDSPVLNLWLLWPGSKTWKNVIATGLCLLFCQRIYKSLLYYVSKKSINSTLILYLNVLSFFRETSPLLMKGRDYLNSWDVLCDACSKQEVFIEDVDIGDEMFI